MKKALVILMAVAMMFAFSATAFATVGVYTDTTNDIPADIRAAVAKASALEIVNGYTDGSFKYNNTITRAEFAKMACITAGYKASGEALQDSKSQYSDVATSQWYTGWINLASSKGYIKGDGNGKFRPDATITNQEVVTILMRLLGYDDRLPGPWPIDYVTEAAKLEVTDGIAFVGSAAAKRGEAAYMVSNTLDQYIVQYSDDVSDFVEKTKKQDKVVANPITDAEGNITGYTHTNTTDLLPYTLLSEGFKGQVEEDVLIADWDVKDYDKQLFNVYLVGGGTYQFDIETAVSDGSYLWDDIYHTADIIYTTKDSKDTIKYVDITSTKITATKYDKKSDSQVELGGKRYTLAAGMAPAPASIDKNVEYLAFADEDNRLYYLGSDADYGWTEASIVKEVDTSKKTFKDANNNTTKLKDVDYLIVKDGKFIELADVKAGDVLLNVDAYDELYVVAATKEAKFTRYSSGASGTATIDGKAFVTGGSFHILDADYEDLGDPRDYYNEAVKYYENADNTISYAVAANSKTSSTLYGVVTDYTLKSDHGVVESTNALKDIELFTSEGKTVTYKVNTTDDLYIADLTVGDVAEYKLNEAGEIKTFTSLNGVDTYIGTKKTYDVDTDDEFVKINNSYYDVVKSTIIFDITMDGDDVDKVSIMSIDTLLKDDEFDAEKLFYKGNDDGALKVLGIVDGGTISYNYGFIEYLDDPYFGLFAGDEYEASTFDDYEGMEKGYFVKFQVSGDKAKTPEVLVGSGDTAQRFMTIDDIVDAGKTVTAINDKTIAYGGDRTKFTSSTVFYKLTITVDGFTVVTADNDDISVDDVIAVQLNADDDELTCVIKVVDRR